MNKNSEKFKSSLREAAITGIIYEKLIDDLDYFPKYLEEKDKSKSDYMNGWNKCVDAIDDIYIKIDKMLKEITEDQSLLHEIENLIISGKLDFYICYKTDIVKLYVECNDLFYWAYADLEYIDISEIDDLKNSLSESETHGHILWACRKRKMRPQSPYYEYFNDSEKLLFDACGPERNV